MKKHLALSGVALSVLLAAITPASAQLLNLGGDNGTGISVGTGDNGDAAVTVDLGSGSNGVVDLGGGDTNATVDLNGGGTSTGNVSIGEDDVDVDVFGPGADGDSDVRVGTGSEDDSVTLDLFGTGNSGTGGNTEVRIGSEGGDDVLLDLFGPSSGNTATATIGTRGGNDDAAIELFGPGGGDIDATETGSVEEDGTGGTGNRTNANRGGPGVSGSTRLATTTANPQRRAGSCFAPDPGQIQNLLNRVNYDANAAAAWQRASKVSIVPLNICPDQRATIEGVVSSDADFKQMQAAVDASAGIKAGMGQYDADDVLAVKGSADALTIYVY